VNDGAVIASSILQRLGLLCRHDLGVHLLGPSLTGGALIRAQCGPQLIQLRAGLRKISSRKAEISKGFDLIPDHALPMLEAISQCHVRGIVASAESRLVTLDSLGDILIVRR
jgi:hypothetical protein